MEYKFRGKRKDNGEWVVSENIMQENSQVWLREFGIWYEVIPETVGMFTGLTDKNGKEIYEGDKVRTPNGGIYPVAFGKINAGRDSFGVEYVPICWHIKFDDGGAYILNDEETGYSYNSHTLEVVGNIHEEKAND